MSDALVATVPYMKATHEDANEGTLLFSTWAAKGLRWSLLGTLEETKQALVMKDYERELGKRICANGRIAQIQASRTELGTFYEGSISNGPGYVRFVAVGSTGELVEGSVSKFCGVVTGTYSFANLGGGTTITVQAVGMFALPENTGATK